MLTAVVWIEQVSNDDDDDDDDDNNNNNTNNHIDFHTANNYYNKIKPNDNKAT